MTESDRETERQREREKERERERDRNRDRDRDRERREREREIHSEERRAGEKESREMLGKSRNIVFSQCIIVPGGQKVGLLKGRVRSYLAS